MRRFKITLSIIGIVAVLILILPFVMGFVVHNKYTRVIEALNTPNVKVKLVNFKRGWFSSKAKVLVSIEPIMPHLNKKEAQTITPVQFQIKQKISHGPFIIDIQHERKRHQFYFAQAYIHSTIKQNKASTLSDLVIHMNGNIEGGMQPFSFKVKQPDARITADNVSAKIQIIDNAAHFIMQLDVPKFNIVSKTYTQTLTDMSVKTDINKYNRYGLWLGHEAIRVSSLVITPSQQKPTTIRDIYVATNSDETSHKIHSIIRLSIQSIQNTQGKYGPYNLNLTLSNIDAKTYFNLNHKIIAMQSDNTFTPQEMREMFGYLLDLFSHGIDINLSTLSINTPHGKLDAQAQINIATTPPAQNTLFTLFGSLTAKANIKISKSLTLLTLEKMYRKKQTKAALKKEKVSKDSPKKQAQDELKQLIEKGWIIDSGTVYTINIVYGKGKLLVNGKPPQALKNGTPGQPLEKIKQKLMQNNA